MEYERNIWIKLDIRSLFPCVNIAILNLMIDIDIFSVPHVYQCENGYFNHHRNAICRWLSHSLHCDNQQWIKGGCRCAMHQMFNCLNRQQAEGYWIVFFHWILLLFYTYNTVVSILRQIYLFINHITSQQWQWQPHNNCLHQYFEFHCCYPKGEALAEMYFICHQHTWYSLITFSSPDNILCCLILMGQTLCFRQVMNWILAGRYIVIIWLVN